MDIVDPLRPAWRLAPSGTRADWTEEKHPRDPDGKFGDKATSNGAPSIGAFWHGTDNESARNLQANGISPNRIFMTTDNQDEAVGSDSEGAFVRVDAHPANALAVRMEPPDPNSPPTPEHIRILHAARVKLQGRLTSEQFDELKSRRKTYEQMHTEIFDEHGHDAITAEFWDGERWFLTWHPEAVTVTDVVLADEDEDDE